MRTVIIIILAGIVLGSALTYFYLRPINCGEDEQCLTEALVECKKAVGTIFHDASNGMSSQTDIEESTIIVHGKSIVLEVTEDAGAAQRKFRADVSIHGVKNNNCRIKIHFAESSDNLLKGKNLLCSLPQATSLPLEEYEHLLLNSINAERCSVL